MTTVATGNAVRIPRKCRPFSKRSILGAAEGRTVN
jgi:hypothetical protein